ncbi:hypothetical protein ANN_22251, partial [Periplaneta americana]
TSENNVGHEIHFLLKKKSICMLLIHIFIACILKFSGIIAACNYDSDCIANAFCKEQTYCECKKDFIYYETGRNFSCLQEALLLGDGCQADIQCTKPFGIHAHCLTTKTSRLGKCECMAGAHFKEGRCYETAAIGEKCLVSNNCYLTSGVTAYCEKSVCVCPNHYHPTQNGRDCIKTVYLDEPCQNDLECVTPNSRCGDVCRCRVNYIQSRQNNSCIRAADNMGDPCVENEQCTMFLVRAECGVNGRCRCTEGFHYIPPNSKCFRDIGKSMQNI